MQFNGSIPVAVYELPVLEYLNLANNRCVEQRHNITGHGFSVHRSTAKLTTQSPAAFTPSTAECPVPDTQRLHAGGNPDVHCKVGASNDCTITPNSTVEGHPKQMPAKTLLPCCSTGSQVRSDVI